VWSGLKGVGNNADVRPAGRESRSCLAAGSRPEPRVHVIFEVLSFLELTSILIMFPFMKCG
jgi:hypothetical protein